MITNPNKTMSLMANYWKGYGNEFARPYVLEYEEITCVPDMASGQG